MRDNVSTETKKQRLNRLQSRLSQQAANISENMVGTTQTVLITGRAKKNNDQISGRTENNRVVNAIGHSDLIGQFVSISIQEALPNSLRGEIVSI